jgi:hypothetical protein
MYVCVCVHWKAGTTYLSVELDDGNFAGFRHGVDYLGGRAVVAAVALAVLDQAVAIAQLVKFWRADKVKRLAV